MHLKEVDDLTELVGSAEWRNRALTPLGAIRIWRVSRVLRPVHDSCVRPAHSAAIVLRLLTAHTLSSGVCWFSRSQITQVSKLTPLKHSRDHLEISRPFLTEMKCYVMRRA
jgi:hypothetical protein